jgi:hypothetical protein
MKILLARSLAHAVDPAGAQVLRLDKSYGAAERKSR